MKFKLLGFLFLCQVQLFGQQERTNSIVFHPLFGQEQLSLGDKNYLEDSGTILQFSTLKFYISEVQFLNHEKVVWQEKNSYHLVDATLEASLKLALDCPADLLFNKVQFQLGIDSVTNVSGAMGGDLDPSKGMYWAWQSGYINFKLEGNSSLCPTRNHEFQFHLGGYLFPFESMQLVTLDVVASKQIDIDVDVSELMHQIDLVKQNQVMSPSYEAKELSFKAISIFKVHQ